jgi:hypothetical protein
MALYDNPNLTPEQNKEERDLRRDIRDLLTCKSNRESEIIKLLRKSVDPEILGKLYPPGSGFGLPVRGIPVINRYYSESINGMPGLVFDPVSPIMYLPHL